MAPYFCFRKNRATLCSRLFAKFDGTVYAMALAPSIQHQTISKNINHPVGDIEIISFIPGCGQVKLYEELLIGDNVSDTEHKIMHACRRVSGHVE